MSKLKLGPLPDDKPVKVTVELPATVHRDPVRLIVPMLERFMATDRGFAKARRSPQSAKPLA